MSTWELYFLLMLPSIRETILGLSVVTLIISAVGAFFFHLFAEDDDRFSDWARMSIKVCLWSIPGIILASFIPTERMMLALVGWELGSSIEGMEHLPANLVEYLNTMLEESGKE